MNIKTELFNLIFFRKKLFCSLIEFLLLNCRLPIQQFLESYCNAPLILKCIMKRGNRLKVISLKCRLQVSSFLLCSRQ